MLWFHNFFMNQQQLEEKYLSAVLSVRNNLVPSENISEKSTFILLCGCKLNQYGELIGEVILIEKLISWTECVELLMYNDSGFFDMKQDCTNIRGFEIYDHLFTFDMNIGLTENNLS